MEWGPYEGVCIDIYKNWEGPQTKMSMHFTQFKRNTKHRMNSKAHLITAIYVLMPVKLMNTEAGYYKYSL